MTNQMKKNEQIHGRINRMPVFNPTIQVIVNTCSKYKPLSRNLLRKITVLIAWRESKLFSIARYHLSLSFCIPNMIFLCYMVVQISLNTGRHN